VSYIFSSKESGGVRIMVKISEFQIKDVVNVSDGKRLGNIGDIEINLTTGKIEAVVITGNGKVLGFFGRDEDIIIPWKNIIKIGQDVILVRYKGFDEIRTEEMEG
jgi:YlmC/YmxH family sporulation protein